MIHLLDDALESWVQGELRTSVGGRDVEVSFETPDRDFDGAGPGPTVNLFLWDIMQSLRSSSGRTVDRQPDGAAFHRGPDPFMEFRYLVSAWGREVRDEHRILGELTRAVMRSRMISEEYLPSPLRQVRPFPELVLGSSGGRTLADLWSAFDGQLRPGLDLVVIVTVDAHVAIEAGKQVWVTDLIVDPPTPGSVLDARPAPAADHEFDVRLVEQRGFEDASRSLAAFRFNPSMSGVRVTSARGAAQIARDGTCVLSADPGSTVTVHTDEPFDVAVPIA